MSGQLLITNVSGIVVAEPLGVFENTDLATIELVRNSLIAELANISAPILLLDLRRAEYFGSPFVGLLFETWLKLKARSGKLAFCNINGDLKRVLGVVRLDTVCSFFTTRESALAALSNTASMH